MKEPEIGTNGCKALNETRAVKLFDMVEGIGTVTNLVAVSNPDVHKFGDRWWMFLGCLQSSNKINLFSASLPPGAPLNSTEWEITTDPSDPHTATPVIEQPEESRDGLARRLGVLRL